MGPDIESLLNALKGRILKGEEPAAFFRSLTSRERQLLARWLSQKETGSGEQREKHSPLVQEGEAVAYSDGASRGNPGEAGYGYMILYPGGESEEGWGYLGTATNNFAEYSGALAVLRRLEGRGIKRAVLYMDSELIVRQLNGVYKVKSQSLASLYEEACVLKKKFDSLRVVHVPRSENSQADRLANKAIDTRETDRFFS